MIAKENVIEVGLKLLSDVKEGESFYTVNGQVLNNIRELAGLLETIQKDHFDHHVNEDKNDFAEWVQYSVGDKKLADRLRKAKKPEDMQQLISERLTELENSLMDYEENSGKDSEKKSKAKSSSKERKSSKSSKTSKKSAKSSKSTKKSSSKSSEKDEEEDDFNKEIEREYQKINDPDAVSDEKDQYYSHDEILQEIEKAISDADSKFVIDSLTENQPEAGPTAISEGETPSSAQAQQPFSAKKFYFADFIIGFALGVLLGILGTIAYYSFFL